MSIRRCSSSGRTCLLRVIRVSLTYLQHVRYPAHLGPANRRCEHRVVSQFEISFVRFFVRAARFRLGVFRVHHFDKVIPPHNDIGDPGRHCGGSAERFVNPAEIVKEKVQRKRVANSGGWNN
jgi:hypothetical protein